MENLTKKERRKLKKEEKIAKRESGRKKRTIKKVTIIALSIAFFAGIILLVTMIPTDKININSLPPTTMAGHIESYPKAYILEEEIPENIQKHILEHLASGRSDGVIIQYNCDKFECEDDLIEKLTALAEGYDDSVYLAPNARYDGKIILTKLNSREILDGFDEEKIRNFIE